MTDPNTDNHTLMAEITGLDRKEAKIVGLGIMYGEGEMTTFREYDIRFLKEAQKESLISPDPSTKVGAIITTTYRSMPQKIIGRGHNCFPELCSQNPEIYADRERKYLRVVHAEVYAILNSGQSPQGGTLYVWPPSAGPTCARCAAVVIASRIKRVVYLHQENEFSERWAKELAEARTMYHEAGVEIAGLRLGYDQFAEHFGG